jgi:hypothetical protein
VDRHLLLLDSAATEQKHESEVRADKEALVAPLSPTDCRELERLLTRLVERHRPERKNDER